jgi:hypothetical protein
MNVIDIQKKTVPGYNVKFFLSLAWMSLTKLSLAGNIKLFPARESMVSDIPAV